MPLLHTQPFKALYLLFEATTTLFVRIPCWALYSIPRSNRPRRSWAISRCIFVYGLRRYFLVSYNTGGLLTSPDHRAIKTGEGVHGVWVEPAEELVKGEIRKRADEVGVEYVRIPGYWFVKKGAAPGFNPAQHRPSVNDKVIYSFHGGGFTAFSAHPSDPLSSIRQGILDHTPSSSASSNGVQHHLFSLEYRLSKLDLTTRTATHRFPTALVDAIAGYNYLVHTVGYNPSNIILEGDSAGANLALALTRYLVSTHNHTHAALPKKLPPPGGLILDSCWPDLSLSHVTPGSSALPAIPADVLRPTIWGPGNSWVSIRSYVGMSEEDLLRTQRDVYISPACLDIAKEKVGFGFGFRGFPRTLIVAGDAELFIDSIRTLYGRMREDMGEGEDGQGKGGVEMYEVKDVVHDFLSLKVFEPERTRSFEKIGKWVAEL